MTEQVFNTSSLDGTNGFIIINNNATDDKLGYSVSAAGDINNDGIDDLIIGAPEADPNDRNNSGTSYIVFGTTEGFASTIDISTLDGINGFTITGATEGDISGRSVSAAGDINNDGIDDLIIGAPSANPNGENSGAAYIIFGKNSFSSNPTIDLSNLNDNGVVINGLTAEDRLGFSVSSAGDVNNDGIDDLIIGAPNAYTTSNGKPGQTYIVFGQNNFDSSFNLSSLDGSNGFIINGQSIEDHSGLSVSSAGDINNDGIDDLIIGAPQATPNDTNSGQAYIVFGKEGDFSPSLDLNSLDGSNGFIINGEQDSKLGFSVSNAGDVNGDGIDDLIIGAHDADPNGITNAGISYVLFGKDGNFDSSFDLSSLNGNNGFAINGINELDNSGWSVSGVGDISGDGIDDLIISANNADPNGESSGQSYVVFGKNNFGAAINLSDIDGTNGFIINGLQEFDNLGNSVSGAGDVNGDGIADLILSAPFADDSGESYVIFGINSAPTDLLLDNNSVDENVESETVIGQFTTTDINATVQNFTYSLVADEDYPDNSLFTIDGESLKINASPDFETKSSYVILVKTTDQGGLSYEKEFTININDIDETEVNTAPTDLALTVTSINENVNSETVIGSFITTDQNTGDTFTYSLVADEDYPDNSFFTIDGESLKINASPDFETKSSYVILVKTTDQGGLSYEKEFTININDIDETEVNTAPTDLALTVTSINENVNSETVIGSFITTDQNTGDTFTYSLVADEDYPDNSFFTIDGESLKINASPDFETKSSYVILVKTTDQSGLSYEKEFTININDIDETEVNTAPTDLALTVTSINENVNSETVIGSFITTDQNTGDTFTYSLVTDEDYPDNSLFTIDGESLKINASPDFETKSSYVILVKTTDQGGLSYEKEFTININDIDETEVNTAPTDLGLTVTSINENVNSETVIGSFITTDQNTGDTFTYSLITDEDYPDNSLFTIDGESLKINTSPDFETKSSYNINVKTTDAAGLSFTKQLTINVNDIDENENPTDGGSSTTKILKVSDDVFKIVSPNSTARLQVTIANNNFSNVNELVAFAVDDASGKIDGIAPGEAGYTEAALENSKIIFSTISKIPNQFDSSDLNKLLGLNTNTNLRFYLVRNGSTDSVKAGITPISNVIFPNSSTLQISNLGENDFSLGWKDSSTNSSEFQDLVVNIQATDNPLTLGTGLQDTLQGENIDLRNVTGLVNAEFTVYREAAFDNYVGFYKVTDQNGGIDLNGDGTADILPGQAGYTQAAVNQHLSNLGLSVSNGQTATFNGTLEGGAIYVPFLIVNSRPDAILDSNANNDPAVYFTFLGANSDQVDHVRLLGDNTFGFEDLTNGGDQDFNDIVVKFDLQTIA